MPRKPARPSRSAAVAPRRRRTAEEARTAILDAAERQLVASGPDALRLQQIAAEVGVSHPTVLHHFGSRNALVLAVVARALTALQSDVVAAIAETPEDVADAGEANVTALLDRVAAALGERGHGRALAWLALSGQVAPPGDLGLRAAAEAAQSIRRRQRGARTPPLEDTQFTLLLAFYALFAQSVIGPLLLPTAGLPASPRTDSRFRHWLARLIKSHLQSGPA